MRAVCRQVSRRNHDLLSGGRRRSVARSRTENEVFSPKGQLTGVRRRHQENCRGGEGSEYEGALDLGELHHRSQSGACRSGRDYRSDLRTTSLRPDQTSLTAHTFTSTNPIGSPTSRMVCSVTVVARPDASTCLSCHHPPHVEQFDAVAKMKEVLGPGHGQPLR